MKTIDAEKLEAALTKRIKFWTSPASGNRADIIQPIITALVDVRQCVREAAGIEKSINED